MNKFLPKPYKLFNKIQHYKWGTKNENAFIPKLLNIEIQKDIPYAELWIGTHPNAPSDIEIEGEQVALDMIIKRNTLGCLGEYVTKKFDGKFPFLLKVLSVANALSIQTHPNKLQAEKLHKLDPKNYPDNNHKPEIAIALDSLIAIAGFRPIKEIQYNLNLLPELKNFINEQLIDKIFNSPDISEAEQNVRNLYREIMMKGNEKENLAKCIVPFYERLKNKKTLINEESEFINQYELFGVDVGLFSIFFFNMIQLEPGQAIFTDAGIPHAYLKGNIIECMANSDNVIRAGLTNKFKDVKALLEIIKYDFNKYEIINSEQKKDEVTYKTIAQEFEVSYFQKGKNFKEVIMSGDKPIVYLITEGILEISWEFQGKSMTQKFVKGDSFFIPASLSEFKISANEVTKFYVVTIP